MNTKTNLLAGAAALVLASSAVLKAQTYTQNFESLTAGDPAGEFATGWFANVGGDVPTVTDVVTADPSLVIDGTKSFLLTATAFPASTSDNELGGYYSGSNGGAFTNVAPGTYQLSVKFRVVDPGVTANLNFYYISYLSFDPLIQTNSVALSSPGFTSADGVVTWNSGPFTILPDNVNFYTALQVQATSGASPLAEARFVLDSSSITAVPEPSSAALLLGVVGLTAGLTRRRR